MTRWRWKLWICKFSILHWIFDNVRINASTCCFTLQFFQILYVSENCFHWRLDEMLEPGGDETWIGKTLIDLSTCVNFQFFRVLYVPDCFLKTVFWVPNFENCLWSLTLLSEEPIPKLNPPVCQKKENHFNCKHVEKYKTCLIYVTFFYNKTSWNQLCT